MRLRMVSIVGCSISFYLPLAVVPAYTQPEGSVDDAGLATGALLVATVTFELLTPRIAGLLGLRWTLAAGLFLLGAPALLLLTTATPNTIIVISLLRGVGFALAVVAGGALTAALLPEVRRGEGLAVVGLAGGLSSLVALPVGLWVSARWGFAPVFMVTAAAALLPIITVPGLTGRHDARADMVRHIWLDLRNPLIVRPAALFATTTTACGVLVTFLPMAMTSDAPWAAPIALFFQPAAATAARLWSGRRGDRVGHEQLLVSGALAAATGMAMVGATDSTTIVVAGSATFGAGYGVMQNATLAMMCARVPSSGFGTVSAIWNAAYDVGMAIGAIGVGLLVPLIGFRAAFLLTAALMLPALAFARRERRFAHLNKEIP